MRQDQHALGVIRNGVVFLAVGVGVAGMWWLREILTPLVLAMFLMVLVDGLARMIDERLPFVPKKAAMPVAFTVCLLAFAGTIWFLAESTRTFLGQIVDYGPKLQATIQRLSALVGMEAPPTVRDLLARLEPSRWLGSAAGLVQNILSDALFVLIYLGFLIASSQGFKRKIVTLFPSHDKREAAVDIFGRIRRGVESYVWVQTVTGLMMAAGAWVAMVGIKLDNALFWAFFIFIASYIPMIGAAAGVIGPVAFALLQFDTYWQAVALFAGLQVVFFVVGNVILPKMQGESLNLDPVVILLSLAFWSAIWGLTGAFLSSPLTVMAMLVLAQFPGTYWIAVLLSDNGEPGKEDAQTPDPRRKRGAPAA